MRQHLTRKHGMFAKLCLTCNETVVDKDIFRDEHGEHCDNDQPQKKGAAAQVQHQKLCEEVFEEIRRAIGRAQASIESGSMQSSEPEPWQEEQEPNAPETPHENSVEAISTALVVHTPVSLSVNSTQMLPPPSLPRPMNSVQVGFEACFQNSWQTHSFTAPTLCFESYKVSDTFKNILGMTDSLVSSN